MQFFKFLLLFLILTSGAYASDIRDLIESREYGSCETNNLYFSAMKFYKIPLNEKHEGYDTFLRVILFFNQNGSLTERVTTQALLGCQTIPNGDVACSYHALEDIWVQYEYAIFNNVVSVKNIGTITLEDPADLNRGFSLKFHNDFGYPHLRGKVFAGGMVSVNFNQHAQNIINICK